METTYRGAVAWKPMALAIDTERLTLRIRDERDAEWYRELVGERGEDTPTLEESTARLARFRGLTIETGIGALAICRRAEGDTIGYCALIVGRASLDEPEIAFELLQQFHGQGYATEAAQALVAAAAALAAFQPLPEHYAGQFHRFYDAVCHGQELPVTLADARVSLELITAMYYSAETDQSVSLPISTDHPSYASWLPKKHSTS